MSEEIKNIERKIKFTTSDGEREIKLASTPYPYLQSAGKVVLKFTASEEDAAFTTLAELKNNVGAIEYLEDDEVKATYEDYTCSASGFVCGYQDGHYDVSLLRKDAQQIAIEKNAADIEYVAIMSGVELEG